MNSANFSLYCMNEIKDAVLVEYMKYNKNYRLQDSYTKGATQAYKKVLDLIDECISKRLP